MSIGGYLVLLFMIFYFFLCITMGIFLDWNWFIFRMITKDWSLIIIKIKIWISLRICSCYPPSFIRDNVLFWTHISKRIEYANSYVNENVETCWSNALNLISYTISSRMSMREVTSNYLRNLVLLFIDN